MVVPAQATSSRCVFVHRRPAEFPAPDDDGRIEEAAAFEVLNQGRGRLVGFFATIDEAVANRPCLSRCRGRPIPVVELNEADARFDEPAGHQAAVGEGALAGLAPLQVECFLCFFGQVRHRRDAVLHAIGRVRKCSILVAFPDRQTASRWSLLRRLSTSNESRRSALVMPSGFSGTSNGSPRLRSCTPWWIVGRKPLPQSEAPPSGALGSSPSRRTRVGSCSATRGRN